LTVTAGNFVFYCTLPLPQNLFQLESDLQLRFINGVQHVCILLPLLVN
jgi:hypothetical protein